MHPEIIFFGKRLIAVRAIVLGLSDMDHLSMFIQVSLLREAHITLPAFERLFLRMGPKMVEEFAH